MDWSHAARCGLPSLYSEHIATRMTNACTELSPLMPPSCWSVVLLLQHAHSTVQLTCHRHEAQSKHLCPFVLS